MHSSSAPLEIGCVSLTVNDIDKMAGFYQTALGLEQLAGDGETVALGAGDRALIELRADASAPRVSPKEAGLFHTAFLVPDRSDLGRWVHHASDRQLPVVGASDHNVSEAIYLTDPEGNGIEIYVDRPRDQWRRKGSEIELVTDPLDMQSLAATANGPWTTAPDGTVVGHVHLQVGAVPEAEAFYAGTLGLELTSRYPGASFYGSGGYHHHIATNIWNSRNSGRRKYPSTGLAELEILADVAELAAIHARGAAPESDLSDPWGTVLRLTQKAA